jgi:hypothetical protein
MVYVKIEAYNIGTLFRREEAKKAKKAKKKRSIGFLRAFRSLRSFAVKKPLSQSPSVRFSSAGANNERTLS